MPLVLALLLALLLAAPASAARPNILIVMTDDQRADTLDVMPLTRWLLARRGTTFLDAHATTPKCCPARASFFTGLYVHNHGVRSNARFDRLDHGLTLQRLLQDRGYRTGIFGKYLNRWPIERNPPYFDDWAITRAGYWRTPWNFDGRVARNTRYSTDMIADRTLRFIRSAEREDSRPWLAWVTPFAPHLPGRPAPRHRKALLYDFKSTPALTERDISDKPPFLERARGFPDQIVKVRDGGRRALMSVDDMVGRLMTELERLGERRRTLVVFTSDNGFMLGEHGGVTGKDLPYPAATRIPLIVSWPGRIPAQRTRRDPVTNLDVTATAFDAARVPWQTDGRSLLRPRVPGRTLLTEGFGAWNNGGLTPLPPWRSMRNRSWRYAEYYDATMSEVIFREFYDLRTDPWELENRADSLDPGDLGWYAARLREMADCKGAGCP